MCPLLSHALCNVSGCKIGKCLTLVPLQCRQFQMYKGVFTAANLSKAIKQRHSPYLHSFLFFFFGCEVLQENQRAQLNVQTVNLCEVCFNCVHLICFTMTQVKELTGAHQILLTTVWSGSLEAKTSHWSNSIQSVCHTIHHLYGFFTHFKQTILTASFTNFEVTV